MTRSKLSRTSSSRFPLKHAGQALRQTAPSSRTPSTPAIAEGRGSDHPTAQIDEPDAVWKVLQQIGGRLQCHAGLADAARAGDRQEPDIITAKKVNHPGNLILPAQKRGRLQWEVVGTGRQCPDRREIGRQVGMQQLEDALRR